MNRRSSSISILLCAFFATYSTESHAYLDPGTASMILQGTIAAIAGATVTIRLYWHRIKSIFTKSAEKEIDTAAEEKSDESKGNPTSS